MDATSGAAIALACVGALALGANVGLVLLTRRLARSTALAAEAAAKAAEAAHAANVEAVRARLDASAPMIRVEVDAVDWPPVFPASFRDGANQPIPSDFKLTVPRDLARRIDVRARGTVANHGQVPAYVRLDGGGKFAMKLTLLEIGNKAGAITSDDETQATLGPGRALVFEVQAGRPLQEWLEAFDHQADAPPQSYLRFDVVVDDHRDNGVIDHIPVVIQAYPVNRQTDDAGSCFAPPQPQAACTVEPQERHYFMSKRKNLRLGEY
jgi:hypothetical protein